MHVIIDGGRPPAGCRVRPNLDAIYRVDTRSYLKIEIQSCNSVLSIQKTDNSGRKHRTKEMSCDPCCLRRQEENAPELRPMTTFGLNDHDVEVTSQDFMNPHDLLHLPSLYEESIDGSTDISVNVDDIAAEKGVPPDDDHQSASGIQGRRASRIAIFCTLAVAIVLASVLSWNDRRDQAPAAVMEGAELENNSVPTFAPTVGLQATAEFQILKPYVNPPSKLVDPDTPQGKAFSQILEENITEDSEFRIKQRFAMMVLYFSTGGETWSWQSGWRDFSENECDWHGVAICRYRDGRKVAAGFQLRTYSVAMVCMLEPESNAVAHNMYYSPQLPTTSPVLFRKRFVC
jgi:hypothetical protein